MSEVKQSQYLEELLEIRAGGSEMIEGLKVAGLERPRALFKRLQPMLAEVEPVVKSVPVYDTLGGDVWLDKGVHEVAVPYKSKAGYECEVVLCNISEGPMQPGVTDHVVSLKLLPMGYNRNRYVRGIDLCEIYSDGTVRGGLTDLDAIEQIVGLFSEPQSTD